jgi:hypothetical protein
MLKTEVWIRISFVMNDSVAIALQNILKNIPNKDHSKESRSWKKTSTRYFYLFLWFSGRANDCVPKILINK